jgi:hypothetical protein
MAAMPESLMLQHKQPFASSRNSSVFSAVGSEDDEMLIVLAKRQVKSLKIERQVVKKKLAFNVLFQIFGI